MSQNEQEMLMKAIELLEYEIAILDAFIMNAHIMYSKQEYTERMKKIAHSIKKIRQADIEEFQKQLLVH